MIAILLTVLIGTAGVILVLLAIERRLTCIAKAARRIAAANEEAVHQMGPLDPHPGEELRKIRRVLERSEAAIEAGLLDEEVTL